MTDGLIFYIAFSYLFEIGCATQPNGSNWYNLLLSPVMLPIKLGMYMATTINK